MRSRWNGFGAAAALVTTRRGDRVPMAAGARNDIRLIGPTAKISGGPELRGALQVRVPFEE